MTRHLARYNWGMARKKTRLDTVEIARSVVERATGERLSGGALPPNEDKQHDQVRGRAGGVKGGRARADSLTPKQRSSIAKKAAKARWNRTKR